MAMRHVTIDLNPLSRLSVPSRDYKMFEIIRHSDPCGKYAEANVMSSFPDSFSTLADHLGTATVATGAVNISLGGNLIICRGSKFGRDSPEVSSVLFCPKLCPRALSKTGTHQSCKANFCVKTAAEHCSTRSGMLLSDAHLRSRSFAHIQALHPDCSRSSQSVGA